MGLSTQLRANTRAARLLYQRLTARGHAHWDVLLRRIPQAVALRAYRKLAYAVNDGVLQRWVTPIRFRQFLARQPAPRDGIFFVIVMPQTLHFLLPCLRLVDGELRVVLLLNGASRWEADLLRERFPAMPQFRVATLPNSSVGHGAMINLLLQNSEHDFGVLDHDLYLFDPAIFRQLRFDADDFLLCLFNDASADGRWVYPLTHFLYFRIGVFKQLMAQYGVGAQAYRQVPQPARSRLASIGLREGETMKSYHVFYDTLHVLLALAYADGLGVAQLEGSADSVYHIGGTSIGTHHTKDLIHLYTHLRFLELSGEPLLQRRYAATSAPFTSADEVHMKLQGTAHDFYQIKLVDQLIEKLRAAEVHGSIE
ncbi:MAG: hypothetical protein JWQ01_1611 [Massilia sp.]|nr:hypothetical protein [Massilia sp.]